MVFGAFPSLHSGCATTQMLFLVYLRPRLWPLAFGYTLWLWWSTMYLTHHYMIDLVGGSIYAFLAFYAAYPFLPTVRPDARTRFDYLGITKVTFRNAFGSLESARPFILQERAEREKQRRLVNMEDDEEYLLGHLDKAEEEPLHADDDGGEYVMMHAADDIDDSVKLRLRRADESFVSSTSSSKPSSIIFSRPGSPSSHRSTPRSPRSPVSPSFASAKVVEPTSQEVF